MFPRKHRVMTVLYFARNLLGTPWPHPDKRFKTLHGRVRSFQVGRPTVKSGIWLQKLPPGVCPTPSYPQYRSFRTRPVTDADRSCIIRVHVCRRHVSRGSTRFRPPLQNMFRYTQCSFCCTIFNLKFQRPFCFNYKTVTLRTRFWLRSISWLVLALTEAKISVFRRAIIYEPIVKCLKSFSRIYILHYRSKNRWMRHKDFGKENNKINLLI